MVRTSTHGRTLCTDWAPFVSSGVQHFRLASRVCAVDYETLFIARSLDICAGRNRLHIDAEGWPGMMTGCLFRPFILAVCSLQ